MALTPLWAIINLPAVVPQQRAHTLFSLFLSLYIYIVKTWSAQKEKTDQNIKDRPAPSAHNEGERWCHQKCHFNILSNQISIYFKHILCRSFFKTVIYSRRMTKVKFVRLIEKWNKNLGSTLTSVIDTGDPEISAQTTPYDPLFLFSNKPILLDNMNSTKSGSSTSHPWSVIREMNSPILAAVYAMHTLLTIQQVYNRIHRDPRSFEEQTRAIIMIDP